MIKGADSNGQHPFSFFCGGGSDADNDAKSSALLCTD